MPVSTHACVLSDMYAGSPLIGLGWYTHRQCLRCDSHYFIADLADQILVLHLLLW